MSDERYDHALAAALVIAGELDGRHDMPKKDLISLIVYTFMHALDSYDADRPRRAITASNN